MVYLDYEKQQQALGFEHICGVDEAGRGSLCGPVVVSCVEMPLKTEFIIDGVDDSKKLSEKKRNQLYLKIIKCAIDYKIAVVDNFIIDDINILEATKLGMRDVINSMSNIDIALIDAVKLEGIKCQSLSIIHGDANSYSIAAASILAKVTRDKMMVEFDKLYNGYGFAKNKGYGTKEHIAKIAELGLCPIHRITFTKKFVKNNENIVINK
ncbi:MAG: ribonuclease HII [Clostridia bacterium]